MPLGIKQTVVHFYLLPHLKPAQLAKLVRFQTQTKFHVINVQLVIFQMQVMLLALLVKPVNILRLKDKDLVQIVQRVNTNHKQAKLHAYLVKKELRRQISEELHSALIVTKEPTLMLLV